MQDATALKMNLVQQSRKQNIADNAAEVDSKLYDYELDLWQARMGKLVKMSCNIWEGERKVQSLTEAEDATLELYMQRADIRNDQDILDLGYESLALMLGLSKHLHEQVWIWASDFLPCPASAQSSFHCIDNVISSGSIY